MEENDIEQLCNGTNLVEITRILQNFLQKNEKSVFTFPSLMENNRRVILWTALFQLLQRKECQSVHAVSLTAIRILSRDKTDLENLLCEKWIKVLIEKAGLYNFHQEDGSMSSIEQLEKDITVEALKCLCNLTFNSEVSRTFCAETDIAQSLIARLKIYNDIPFKDEIMLFDMKLLFILTALRHDIRAKIKDLHGMDYLTSCLNEIILEASSDSHNAPYSYRKEYFLQDEKHAIACDILKAQFNLIMQQAGAEEAIGQYEEAMFLKLMPVLTAFLYANSSTEEKMFDLHNNIANLLTSVPSKFFTFLTPLLNEEQSARYTYDARNMDALQSLVNLLQHKLAASHNTAIQYENLSPILTVMNKCARVRSQRKYLRQVVLPPLRDVSLPPEKGNTLRNQLCRLLTTPATTVRDLVAEFLFILCKEKVGRMVKYTGFGNAAGHLAQKGLLSGVRSADYSSSSDDSDTEEYLEAQPNIDPVVGCTRPPRVNPFEGMTEEQKEYEAMKLVNLFDAMVTQGLVKPARIGPDGRPQPVDHVLELRDDQPKRSQS